MKLLRYGSAIERLGNRYRLDSMLSSDMAVMYRVKLPQSGST